MRDKINVFPIELAVPFNGDHSKMYLVTDNEVGAVIDAGAYAEQNQELITMAIKEAGLAFSDIKAIMLTHSHPDHWGMAEWLHQISGAKVCASVYERDQLWMWRFAGHKRIEGLEAFFRKHGMPSEMLGLVDSLRDRASKMGLPPEVEVILRDGQLAGPPSLGLRALLTPGHSLGHTCFWNEDEGLLFCGDHLLADITPNVGANFGNEEVKALSLYTDSLERVKRMAARLALPGHGSPIWDIISRANEIKAHHEERLSNALKAVEAGRETVYQVVTELFPWELSPIEYQLAFHEVYAHLEELVRAGQLRRVEAKGIVRYSPILVR
ncbi:MAG TPA: MBL fold metallo-hydrolase [Firmicutes bacterium]|nr:MBL fold metallo-hydrolase [Bacillota bacterium]